MFRFVEEAYLDATNIVFKNFIVEKVYYDWYNFAVGGQKQSPGKVSKISVLFFYKYLFLDFSRRLYVLTEQIVIFQEGIFVPRTDNNLTFGWVLKFVARYEFFPCFGRRIRK